MIKKNLMFWGAIILSLVFLTISWASGFYAIFLQTSHADVFAVMNFVFFMVMIIVALIFSSDKEE